MRLRYGRNLILLVCLGVLLAGCRSNPFGDMPEQLTNQVRVFEDVVRWRDLRKMYAFYKGPTDEPVPIQQGLENVRVTGYELTEPLNQVTPMRWRQAARIDYVLTDRQIVKQLVDLQIWESEDEGKTWYRTTPVPQFK